MVEKGHFLGAIGMIYRGREQWTGRQGRSSISDKRRTTKTVVMEPTV